jgi:hypothetical protein
MCYEWCVIIVYKEQDTALLYRREEVLEDCTADGKNLIVERRGHGVIKRRRRVTTELI